MTTNSERLFQNQHFVNSQSVDNSCQYSNLNLNQKHRCSILIPVQSYSKSSKDKNCDSTASDNYKEKKELQSWNKFSKTVNLKNNETEEEKEAEKSSSKNTNNSTLSLHISAYENSFETLANNKNNDGLKKDKFESIENKMFNVSTFVIQNPFEFPRQQNDKISEPEMYHYTASQQFINPNTVTYNDQQNITPNAQYAVQQQQQQQSPLQYSAPHIPRNSYEPAKSGGTAGWNDPPPMNSLPPQQKHPSLKKYPRPVDPSIQNNIPFNQYSQHGYGSNQNTGASVGGGSSQWNAPSNQHPQYGYAGNQSAGDSQWNNTHSNQQQPQYGYGNQQSNGGAQWNAPVNQAPQYGYGSNQNTAMKRLTGAPAVGVGSSQWNAPSNQQQPQHRYSGNQSNGGDRANPWNSGPQY